MIALNRILVLAVGIFGLVSQVQAGDDDILKLSPPVPAGVDESNLDGGQQKIKSIQDFHEAQVRLEKAYQGALALEHDPTKKRQLIASQKAWLKYADSVIAYFYPASSNDWGSGTVTFLNVARIKLINDRIRVLTPGDVYQ